jgi:4-hydroxy-tetrahydrodipicolinate reductase
VAAASDTVVLPSGSGEIPLFIDPATLVNRIKPQVLVDFTNGDGATVAIRAAIPAGVRLVTGSTGIPEQVIEEAGRLAREHGVGVIVAPNFALGAVLLGYLGGIAARHFDYAEVLESHHEKKIDAPSGTALSLVDSLLEGKGGPFTSVVPDKETLAGTRGGLRDGVNVHSGRMPGRLAHHEIVFGAPGQTLALIHDSIGRDSFMPGVMTAVRRVMTAEGLIVGLDRVLGLEPPPKAKP